ncbi:hypothetical protein B0T21DRAFT_368513 [Apiosordaria backusii]|uniref:Uncharacterized protein n=1 Tax=Apiosordaria backusii TaxID=314023 RepID=A0AA40BKD5_9PEZI|nr:hypothetical protein B0T21DRAFT_368513 [Apiosordaria backusii]
MVSNSTIRPAAAATSSSSSSSTSSAPAMKRGLSRHPRLAAATLALTLTALTVQQLSSRARENESARKKEGDLYVSVDRSGGGI